MSLSLHSALPLKLLRTKSNTTQKELAEKLGISTASIIACEKGQKTPSIDVAVKFADHFKTSLDTLCCRDKSTAQFENYGGIARLLHMLFDCGLFCIKSRSIAPSDYVGAPEIAEISTRDIFCTGGDILNDFLLKYEK